MRFRLLRTMAVCLATILVIPGVPSGDEKSEANLSFAMPEGETLRYDTSMSSEYNFMGMDVVQNQSYEVEIKLASVTEEGNYRVSIEFLKSSSSMLVNDDIQEWTPPLQLEGGSVITEVGSNGELLDITLGGNIPGLRNPEDLRSILEIWFLELPDTMKRVGDTWRREVEEGGGKTKHGEEIEPDVKGWSDITFKKIEKKKGIEVASLEVESKLDINRNLPGGKLSGKGEGKSKYYVAVDGGYIVEMKTEFEIKGKVTSPDGEESDSAITQYFEAKLKK